MYTTIAGLGGVPEQTLMTGSGPLPPDGVDMWGALLQGPNATSRRTEVVINIMNGPAAGDGNAIAPEAVYTPAHDDPLYSHTHAHRVLEEAAETRPFPELLPCDDGSNATLAALQSWKPPASSAAALADICSTPPPPGASDPGFESSPCWNVQRSGDKLILWPRQTKPNALFGLIEGRLVSGIGDGEGAVGEVCVGAVPGQQLAIFHKCTEITAKGGPAAPLVDGWRHDPASGQLRHGASCATANHQGSPGGGGGGGGKGGKFFGALRSGPWKLIAGYPGNGKAAWDGWVPLKGPDGSTPLVEGSQEGGTDCVESPCLFNIDLDPNEHDDVAAKTPAVVQQLHARLLELAKSEVTVQAAGLCPTKYGSHNDPRCGAKAKETGFWEPWL